jgi:hypothetical protein
MSHYSDFVTLNAKDLGTYTADQVASLVDLDVHAVRDEGFRRQALAEKKLARLARQMAAARREMAESHRIIEAAFRQMAEENK